MTAFADAISKSPNNFRNLAATITLQIEGLPIVFSNRWLPCAWQASTKYPKGSLVINDTGKQYQCLNPGTSASSGGPTGTGGSITDGGCVWQYISTGAEWFAGLNANQKPAQVWSALPCDKDGKILGLTLSATKLDISGGRADMGTARVEVVDLDGTLASWWAINRTDGWCTLAPNPCRNSFGAVAPVRRYGRWETAFNLDPHSPNGYTRPTPGQIYWVDREAVRVTAITAESADEVAVSVVRGMYRSKPEPHNADNWVVPPTSFDFITSAGTTAGSTYPWAQQNGGSVGGGLGAALSPYPRKLDERMVWIRLGYNASSDAECTTLYRGTIRNFGFNTTNGGTFVVSAEDGQSEILSPLFYLLGEGWDADFPDNNTPPGVTGGDFRLFNASFSFSLETYSGGGPCLGPLPMGFPYTQTANCKVLDAVTGEVVAITPTNPFGLQQYNRFYALLGNYVARCAVIYSTGGTNGGGRAQISPVIGYVPQALIQVLQVGSWQWYYQPEVPPTESPTLPARPVVLIGAGTTDQITSTTDTNAFESDLPWLGRYALTTQNNTPAYGDHPLAVALAIMLSTGERFDTGSTSTTGAAATYEVLPLDWGLAVDPASVDITGIEALIAATPGLAVRMVITEQVPDARDWITKQLLQPFSFYLYTKADGTLSVGSIADVPAAALIGLTAVTLNDLVLDSSGQFVKLDGPTCMGQFRQPIALDWKAHPYINDGKVSTGWQGTINFDQKASVIPNRDASKTSIEVLGSYLRQMAGSLTGLPNTFSDAPIGQVLMAPGRAKDSREYASDLLANLVRLAGVPPAQLTVEVGVWLWNISVGNLASVTIPNLPSFLNTTPGWSNVVCQVIQRTPKPQTGSLELILQLAAVGGSQQRYLNPACIVSAYGGTTLTIHDNQFTASPLHDTVAFQQGDVIRIYAADLGERTAPITLGAGAVGSTTFTIPNGLTLPSGTAIGAGCVVLMNDYGTQSARVRSRFAFRVDATQKFSTGDIAHAWSP